MNRLRARERSQPAIIEIEGNQFPFGVGEFEQEDEKEGKGVWVRSKVGFRSPKEQESIIFKINLLKNASHRNVINIRSVQEGPGNFFTVYYNYVPLSIQNAFQQIDHQSFQNLHRQVIQLAIHLAKNYILASFHPCRCGIVFVDQRPVLKYFLPLQQITITQDIAVLERSVHLFKLQAIHLLDQLRHPDGLSDTNTIQSDTSIKVPTSGLKKRNSEVIADSKNRGLPIKSSRGRKYSNYNELVSQIRRKRSQDSTHCTQMRISGLKQTLKTIRTQSERKRKYALSREKYKIQVDLIKVRSTRVLKQFEAFRKEIAEYVALARLLKLCRGI